MNGTHRRRILAASCLLGLAASYLFSLATGPVAAGTLTHGTIAGAGFLAVLNAGLMAGAVIAITQLVRGGADLLGLTGGVLTLLGATVAARITVLIQLSLLEDASPGAARTTMTKLVESAPLVWASIIPIGLMFPAGLITLGIALIVARPVHRGIGVMLVIGGVLFPLGRAMDIVPAIYACDIILAITFATLGWQLLKRPALWQAA
ncbi:MAG TPA: hypothetical protein VGF48_14355 [Thermoanaerobaculia bacterium]|jgi:hypothetical protein